MYIGDDVTDEDAFRMMGDLGGLGIIVSETAVEDSTAASYALHNPLQVGSMPVLSGLRYTDALALAHPWRHRGLVRGYR